MPVQHNALDLENICRVPAYFSQLVLLHPTNGGLVHVNGQPIFSDTEDKLLGKLISSLHVIPVYTYSMTNGQSASNQVYNPYTNTFNSQTTKDPEVLVGMAYSSNYGGSYLVIELNKPIQIVLPRDTVNLKTTYDYQGQRANRQYIQKLVQKGKRDSLRELKATLLNSGYTSVRYENYVRNRPVTL